MKFIVCVKQVPDVAAPIYLREGEIAADSGRMVMNAYDASAVEASLVLKEKAGGEVSVVLVGPQSGQETLRKALAMGADAATHLLVDNTRNLDSRAYAELLADYIRSENFDVVACGKQAQDTDAGLTGCMLAELLDLPYAANAVALDLEGDSVIVIRQGDSGQEEIQLETPCLVTCSNDMNDPRIPNLKGIMAAKRKTIEMRQAVLPPDIQLPILRVRRHEPVPDREPGRILEGETNEVVATLVDLLQNESGVL
jgi:electron transfer flavoprotein beta subunit